MRRSVYKCVRIRMEHEERRKDRNKGSEMGEGQLDKVKQELLKVNRKRKGSSK